ncbi:MAG TPA: hypothetical protein PLX89_01890 [Verrucomicrobiota bacterium]|nr:hypothetical protein [Verrucomicrobiota bacterium]
MIQRYTKIPVAQQKPNYWQGLNADLRVSDDGNMAVKHVNGVPDNTNAYQEFFATPAVLRQSAQVLQAIDSAFTITQGQGTLVGPPPNSRLAWLLGRTQTLYEADISNQDLARSGQGDYTFNACSANMSNFIGVLRTLPLDPQRLEQRRDLILKLHGAFNFEQREINVGEELTKAMREARQIATGANTSGEAKTAYNALSHWMRQWVSWRYGLNASALPDIGEGWGIMQGGKKGQPSYGHYAPVIAQSDHDRVTLENDVSQRTGSRSPKIGTINPNWYMRMFGPVKKHWFSATEDQSFYGEALRFEEDDFGENPLVARIGSTQRRQQN